MQGTERAVKQVFTANPEILDTEIEIHRRWGILEPGAGFPSGKPPLVNIYPEFPEKNHPNVGYVGTHSTHGASGIEILRSPNKNAMSD